MLAKKGSNSLSPLAPLLIGRERERSIGKELLGRAEVRLLTLTGPGGVGKTRLALELAQDLQSSFEAVYFVPLASVRDPIMVIPRVAQVVGLQENGKSDLFDYLKNHLETISTLLVLDNFEQVSAAATQLPELLRTCPDLKLLVTSRSALHIYNEYEFSLTPLALPVSQQLHDFQNLMNLPAISLFVQRAQAVKFDFTLTPENAEAVSKICIKLDGLPLALELAAARVKLLPPATLLNRLETTQQTARLQLLTGGSHDLPLRQQTLRNTLAWSYDLLDDTEKRLFGRLAVFEGGGTLEEVESICNYTGNLPFSTLDGIASLLDKSLLTQLELPGHSEPRFMMLETIREYALERLEESGEATQLRQSHSQYFLKLAEQADGYIKGPEQQTWLNRLETEHDNLRAALLWTLKEGESEIFLRLSSALAWFWFLRGFLSEGRGWLGKIFNPDQENPFPDEESNSKTHSKARAKAWQMAGILARFQSDFKTARQFLEISVEAWRKVNDNAGLAEALAYLGIIVRHQGEIELARICFDESLLLARNPLNRPALALTLMGLGELATIEGEYQAARDYLEQSLRYWREQGDHWGLANALNALGEVLRCEGQHSQAEAFYNESLQLFQELNNKWRISATLHNLGHVACFQRNYLLALERFREGLKWYIELDHKIGVAVCIIGIARVAGANEQFMLGARLLGAANTIIDRVGIFLDIADQADYKTNLESIRSNLGDQTFQIAWDEGAALRLEQAIALAQQFKLVEPTAHSHPTSEKQTSSDSLENLTDREIEILKLFGQGMTYNQIATKLVISSRTVDAHLRSIYQKLGVTSRTAATNYLNEHKLT